MNRRFSKILIVSGLISIFGLLPFQANAAIPAALIALIPTLIEFVKGLAIFSIIIWLIGAIGDIAGQIINAIATFGDTFLTDFAVISEAWRIIRDFVNLFFILILLVIAFATIFNVKDYKASDLLPKLIIAALLINFSFVITTEVVNFAHIPADVFLKGIGAGISEKLANALEIQTGFTVVDFIGSFVVLFVNSFILTWIAIILLVRIPALIGLAVLSPVAWLGLTLPYIKQNTWSEWWKKLLCWSLIPVAIFGLIYFAVLIDQGVEAALPESSVPLSTWWGLSLDQTIGFAITAGLLLGGLWYLRKVSCGVGNFVYGWVSAGLFGALGYGWRGTGIPGGTKKFWGGVKESGLGIKIPWTQKRIPIYGGAQARERREEMLAGVLGRPFGVAPGLEAQREFKKRVNEEQEKLARDLNEGRKTVADLLNLARNVKTAQGAAAAIIMAKRGEINENQAIEYVKKLDSRTLTGQEFSKAMAEGNFRSFSGGPEMVRDFATGKGIFSQLGHEADFAKQEAINYLKKEEPATIFDNAEDLDRAYQIMSQRSLNDAKSLYGEAKKKRLATAMWAEYVTEERTRGRTVNLASPTPANSAAVVSKIRRRAEDELNRANYDFFNNQDVDTYRDPVFRAAMRQIFTADPAKKTELRNNIRNTTKQGLIDSIT